MQEDILDIAAKAGQEHLVAHYKSIKDGVKAEKFLAQLKAVDFDQTNQLFNDVYLHHKNGGKGEDKIEYQPLKNVADRSDVEKN